MPEFWTVLPILVLALNAGYAGAKEVTGVDASQLAVDQATANAALNGLSIL